MTHCLLALDTSTDLLAAGLLTPCGAFCVNEPGGTLASARLIPALMALLAQGGVGFADLQAIAFGQGPGAFTGLRTACAVAQGLALAHDTPVLAIDSLLIVAEDARQQAGPAHASPDDTADWWVVMDARMGEAYAAVYQHDGAPDRNPHPGPGPGHHGAGSGWQVRVAPQLWTLAALADAWRTAPPQRVAGSGVSAFAHTLPWAQAARWPDCADRAGALLRLARAAWQAGRAIAADQALPLYLRDKVAQTSAERLAQRAAGAASPLQPMPAAVVVPAR